MRNAFAKRFAAVLMGLGLLAALPVSASAATPKTFTVTFYGGEYGVYSEAYVNKLSDQYGSSNVVATATDGGYSSISVRVAGGAELPALPQGTSTADAAPEIASNNEAYGVLLGNWIYSGNTADYVAGADCMSNYNVTPEFYLSSDTDVQYVLRFLLEGTEQEVAATQYGTAPADAFVSGLKVTAPNNLAEYTLNVQATLNNDSNISYADGTFTLKSGSTEAGSTLEYVFYYTQNEHVTSTTQYEDGGTVVDYNDVNVAAGGAATTGGAAGGTAGGAGAAAGGTTTGGAAAGGAAGGAGAAAGGDQNAAAEVPQAGGEEAIGDNETPQAGGNESIGDNETPLAESESGGVNVPLVAGGVAAVVIIALIAALVIRKRGNGAD